MDQMAYYNDNYFNINFKKYHPDDDSLICQNNTLYYYGEPKVISGMITVQNNERVHLNRYKISNMNVDQWQMEPYQIFFFIRESVKVDGIDVKANIMIVYKTASKQFLDESDKFSLSYTVDYFNSLKTIEKHLSGDLFDSYNYIKDIFTAVRSMDNSNITPGFRLIYEKVFGEIKNDINNSSNSSSNVNGIARTKHTGPVSHAKITPIFQDTNLQDDNQQVSNAAFISVVALVILILAIVLGTMTYIFS